MTEKETLSDGKVVTRNDSGQFTSVQLTSEQARVMAKGGTSNKAINTTSTTLLEEAGYSDPEQAPEHLRLLSEIAASKRSSAVSALRDFRKLTQPERSEPAPQANLREVEPFLTDNYDYITVGDFGLYVRVPGRTLAQLRREMGSIDVEAAAEAARR
jgi:hypothetical protein